MLRPPTPAVTTPAFTARRRAIDMMDFVRRLRFAKQRALMYAPEILSHEFRRFQRADVTVVGLARAMQRYLPHAAHFR